MSKKIISTTQAPAAIGPYSQAVQTGNLVFTSGQLGMDPVSGELAAGVEAQGGGLVFYSVYSDWVLYQTI